MRFCRIIVSGGNRMVILECTDEAIAEVKQSLYVPRPLLLCDAVV